MPNNNPLILAIDLGTSGPKVALVTPAGRVLGSEVEPTDILLLPNHGAEQDPDDWWAAIRRAVHRLLARGLAPVDAITGVCCTSQWSGTVPVDENGRHLTNAIIWMDARGQPYVQKLTRGPVVVDGYGLDKVWTWVRRTGGIPTKSGKDSVAHILYLKHEKPAIYQAAYKFMEPKDYLNLRLTGRFAASFDSITLHWVTDNRDIDAIDYDPALLKMAGLEREKLPDLKRAVDILGPILPEVAADLGLSEQVQVVMGTPDIHSAAVGSGAVRDYAAHLYVGTSSWIACHLPFKKTDLFHNMATLPSAIPGRYLLINEQEIAGGALNFLRDNIFFADDGLGTGPAPADVFQRFDRLVMAAPPGSGGVLFAPWLQGERTPVDDSKVRGGFHNVSLSTTRGELIRAVYEGVALNSRWLLYYVEKFIKRKLDAINLVGGGALGDVWCQIYADVLGRTIHQVADPIQVNARGAGLLGAVGLGYINVDEIDEQVEIAATYEPNPANQELYDNLYAAFTDLYKQNRKLYAKLSK
jgi:xylulokinase